MTRKSIYSAVTVIFLSVMFLFTPFTRMTVCSAELFPMVVLTNYTKTMAIGEEFYLAAVTSDLKQPTFKSSKSSIASVNCYGLITAKKAGTCKITAKIKNAEASCLITVMPTTVTLSHTDLTLYRQSKKLLTATVSTGHAPTWKSSRSSVATVDEKGMVTAIKHGTAKITVTADGTSKICTVTVNQPTITLSSSKLSLTVGETHTLHASVSSGNHPEWTSGNMNVATVDEHGIITARQKGRAYIYAREDGVKASCIVTVSEAPSK